VVVDTADAAPSANHAQTGRARHLRRICLAQPAPGLPQLPVIKRTIPPRETRKHEDYASRFALVAVEPASRRGVAIARYEPAEQDGIADVAIAVTPGWRDNGLATELLRMLAQAASERGIRTFTGTYLAENRPVTALINTADEPAEQVTSHGIAKFSVALPPPDPGP
jgi:GNAT superfamily N-acetyltransferase